MGMGFDPSAMAMMYQNMMKSGSFRHTFTRVVLISDMAGMNAPAINPNMAMRNGGMGMMGGMGGMGMGGMGMGMGGMGMGGMGMMNNMGGGGGGGSGGMGRVCLISSCVTTTTNA
jgi:RNA-binding protein Musashi